MRKKLCVLLAVLIACAPWFFGGCASDAKELDEYTIDAEYEEGVLTAEQEVRFYNRSPEAWEYVEFNLFGNAWREGASPSPVPQGFSASAYYAGKSYGQMQILSAEGEGVSDWEIAGQDENILRVHFREPLGAGDEAVVAIRFSLTLARVNHRTGIARRSVNLGNFYPVLCVWEEGDFAECTYESCGDPFYSACADYRVTFTADAEYTVAASGRCLSAEEEGGRKRYEYALENARDFALVLGTEYELLQADAEGVQVMYLSYSDQDAAATLAVLCEAITYFSHTFGRYPYKTYTAVQTGFCFGGMEYPALVMLSDAVSGKELFYPAVHETAHQWWYAAVGSDQRTYAWLDEGLAEYSSALFFGAHEGRGFTFSSLLSGARSAYNAYCTVQEKLCGEADTRMDRPLSSYGGELAYVNIAYNKGMLLFDSLRAAVGEKRFTAGLRRYFSDFSGKIARPEDLAASFSGKAGAAADVIRAYTEGRTQL